MRVMAKPHTPSQVFGVGFSLGRASNARSRDRISQTLRASIRTGPGILPSATISSNFAAETPMYIAASSRDRPRRGSGRTSESARVMAGKSAYVRSSREIARRAERRLVVTDVEVGVRRRGRAGDLGGTDQAVGDGAGVRPVEI